MAAKVAPAPHVAAVASYVNPIAAGGAPILMPTPLPDTLEYATTHFVNAQGLRLHMHKWKPRGTPPKAVVVALHGLNTHIGYTYAAVGYTYAGSFVEALVTAGYAVVGIDHQSMGLSDGWMGRKGNVRRFKDIVRDISDVAWAARDEHAGARVFLCGVSFGGMMALRTALVAKPGLFDGLILCAPAVHLTPASTPSPVVRMGVTALAAVLPALKVVSEPGDPNDFWQKRYLTDPFCYTGGMRARFCAELLRSYAVLDRTMASLTMPFLLFQGERDDFADPSGAKAVFAKASSTDKTVIYLSNMGHALTGDPGCHSIFRRTVKWLDEHVAAQTPIVQAIEKTVTVYEGDEEPESGSATPTRHRASAAQLFRGAVRAIVFQNRLEKVGWRAKLGAALR